MKTNYTIETLDKAPAMTGTFHDVVGTYQEAVAAAQKSYRETGRTTTLRSGGERAGYWWHRISNGIAIDRNLNSGVPAKAVMSPPAEHQAVAVLDASRYALVSDEGEYFSLKMGRDVPGLPNHGSAVEVGRFSSFASAKEYAVQRGASAERIYGSPGETPECPA